MRVKEFAKRLRQYNITKAFMILQLSDTDNLTPLPEMINMLDQ